MEDKKINEIENLKEQIKKEVVDNKNTEKKGNRLCNDKQRKRKRQKEKKSKNEKNANGKIKFSKKKIMMTILIALVAFILIIGIVVGVYIYKADGNIATAALNMAADVMGEDDPIFILVLGVSEDIQASLTDTIILAGYNPDSQKAFMLSIPRDTFVGTNEAYAGGYDKINALYQKGPEKTVAAVEKLTGIDIAHYVIVKNTALPAIVSAIGEVEFDVPIDMDYDDPTQNLHIHLKAGLQMIDGDEAEQLLRFRHNNDGSSYPSEYGDNDYGRMRTQREFIKAVASHLINGNNLSHIKQIASAVFDNIETDMSLSKMLGYAPSALKLNIDGVRMEQLPGASEKLNNLWFYKHNSIETYDLINELLTDLTLDDKEKEKNYTPTKKVKPTTSSKKTNTTIENTTTTNLQENTTVTNTVKEHSHSYESKTSIKATCTTKGERVYTCTTCSENYSEPIPALGHNFETIEKVSGKTTTIIKTCKNQGCDYKETSSKTEKEPEVKNEVETPKVNEIEKEEVKEPPACEHTYTNVITQNATCEKDGVAIPTCSSCGDKKEAITIPAIQHVIEEETTVSGTTQTTTKKCTREGCSFVEVTQKEITQESEDNNLENAEPEV